MCIERATFYCIISSHFQFFTLTYIKRTSMTRYNYIYIKSIKFISGNIWSISGHQNMLILCSRTASLIYEKSRSNKFLNKLILHINTLEEPYSFFETRTRSINWFNILVADTKQDVKTSMYFQIWENKNKNIFVAVDGFFKCFEGRNLNSIITVNLFWFSASLYFSDYQYCASIEIAMKPLK